MEEFQLAAATNGMVFRDDMGVFSDARKKLLAYYPERFGEESWHKVCMNFRNMHKVITQE